MRRPFCTSVVVLACALALLSVLASAEMQRGGQGETRMLIGHVISAQNQPVQKAIVYLKNTKSLLIKTYITEADGSYRFTAIAPNVDYEIYAEHEGLRSDTKTLSAFDNRKEPRVTLRLHNK